MDGPLVWSNQHHQSGTLMPSGAVHTIFARSEATKQSILSLTARMASRSLSSGAHSRDLLARNDELRKHSQTLRRLPVAPVVVRHLDVGRTQERKGVVDGVGDRRHAADIRALADALGADRMMRRRRH